MSDNESIEYATGWRPEPGDVLTGRVTELSVGHGNWGSYPIVVIRPDDGTAEIAVHAFHHSLRNRLLELKPRPGERIGLQFKGVRPHKTNPSQTVAIYIVRIDGRDATSAWESLTPAGEPPTAPTQAPAPANPQQEAFSAEDFKPTPQNAVDDDIPF